MVCAWAAFLYAYPVRILEALKILEAATVESKTRDIDTPQVREALDVLAPYCRPEWRVTRFRSHLKAVEEFGPAGEGQQQNVRVYFAGINSTFFVFAVTIIEPLDSCREQLPYIGMDKPSSIGCGGT